MHLISFGSYSYSAIFMCYKSTQCIHFVIACLCQRTRPGLLHALPLPCVIVNAKWTVQTRCRPVKEASLILEDQNSLVACPTDSLPYSTKHFNIGGCCRFASQPHAALTTMIGIANINSQCKQFYTHPPSQYTYASTLPNRQGQPFPEGKCICILYPASLHTCHTWCPPEVYLTMSHETI